ncbi:nephrin-like [Schistocerca americana]|uniref:nephrin-like n=1 Tax=Schistocerca americana TaxID=7009 RepID=UPI001F500E8D|nr:nephrin-like [Schistocerca americana]
MPPQAHAGTFRTLAAPHRRVPGGCLSCVVEAASRALPLTFALAFLLAAVCAAGHSQPHPLRHVRHRNIKNITIPAVEVQAVEGRSVALPCNVTPPGHDRVYMVFWFRDDEGIPLYSFDVRGKPLSQAAHWSAPEVFGSRAYFRTVSDPAQLVLEPVTLRDEGVYRCRVDFRNAPTRSARYNLTVIVLPETPVILDRWGRRLNKTLGPLLEGDDITLNCRVVGGKPEPRVRWLLDGEVLDADVEQNVGDVIENRVSFRGVARRHLGAVFACRANNTPLTEPREAALQLDLLLPPLEVWLSQPQGALEAGRRYHVSCEAAGSRPPAVITWYKGRRQLRKIKEETRENATLSELSFVPGTDDDGRSVTCRAENPSIPGSHLDATWTLAVVFAPIVTLRLGPTLRADNIKEGDDVYFECHVKANPPWKKLTWLHNDEVLPQNASPRVIHSNQSLALQQVTRHSAGRYVCVAANAQGETASNSLLLRVKYAPRCRHERIVVVGASRSETLDISCHVDADPPARAFRWKFNNSGETMEVSPERFSSAGEVSVLRYTVQSDLDYGSLSCWADNEVGTQAAPCVFQVVTAGKPFPARNCSLWNQTSSSVEVVCQPGFDGGLPQHFALVLHSGGGIRYNLTAETPAFTLTELQPDISYWVAIFAVNAKGRSPPVLIEEITLRDAERHVEPQEDSECVPLRDMSPALTSYQNHCLTNTWRISHDQQVSFEKQLHGEWSSSGSSSIDMW